MGEKWLIEREGVAYGPVDVSETQKGVHSRPIPPVPKSRQVQLAKRRKGSEE